MIVFIIVFAVATALALLVGLTIEDIRAARIEIERRRHPHARKWRQRPLVSVLIDGDATEAYRTSLRGGSYKKLQFISDVSEAKGEFILRLRAGTTMDRDIIKHSIARFMANPRLSSIEILPRVSFVQSILPLARAYHTILTGPLLAARNGLRLPVRRSAYPLITRLDSRPAPWANVAYDIARFVAVAVNLGAISYAYYLAMVAYQPDFLAQYIILFALYAAWAIVRYPYISLFQRIGLILLAPVSLFYFVYRCLAAPLSIAADAVLAIYHVRRVS